MTARDAEVFVALRADLLRGDLTGLAAHLDAFAALESRLALQVDPDTLAALRAEADRNRDLLAASAAGVRAALRRLGEAASPSAVYAPDGRRVRIGGAAPDTESRA
jgi:hypothetical protein